MKNIDPMKRAPGIQNLLDAMQKGFFGVTASDSIHASKCMTCGGDASQFKDEVSAREYGMSGMCQECQDNFFEGGPDGEDPVCTACIAEHGGDETRCLKCEL